MNIKNEFTILNNDLKMPILGLGTYKVKDYKDLDLSVKTALEIGYRHIDTASFYENEEALGKIIKESNVNRDDLFLATKLWNTDHGYEKTLNAFNYSLKKLKTDYVDLYLIHWPNPNHKETWRAMEKLYRAGYIKAIGVSNYKVHHIKELTDNFEITPAVNQIEFHPELVQTELMDFCKNEKIQIEAWSPLMRGKIFGIELFKELSEKYNKSISQIVLRWDIQMGTSTIPKSIKPERIKENSEIFDFVISDEDMKKISSLNINKRISHDPDDLYTGKFVF